MEFFTFVIIIVAIGSGTTMIAKIADALKPKMRKKDLAAFKAEIIQELRGDSQNALPEASSIGKRIDHLEEQVTLQESEIRQLNEENTFLKRLVDKDE